jgi:hypothetical protein
MPNIRKIILNRIENLIEENEEDLQISVFEDMSDEILIKTFEEIIRKLEEDEVYSKFHNLK